MRINIKCFYAAAAAALIGLTGCGGANAGGTEAPAGQTSAAAGAQATTAATPANVQLSFLRIGNDEAERTFWNNVISSYGADHPGVMIAYDEAAIGDAMDEKLTAAFSGNSGPDIIGHGIMSIASRAEQGHYVPITRFYDNWAGKSDIFPQLVQLGTYKGDVYGIAYSPTPYVFAYRKDLLAAAGYDKPPQTWGELLECAEKLTVKDAGGNITQAGFAFPSAGGNLVEYDVFAFGNGGGFVDANGGPTLNSPENIEAMQYVQKLMPFSIPYNNNETNPFMTGNAAMTLIDNIKLSPMFKDAAYKDKIALAMPPVNKGKPADFSGCRLLFIGKDCKNQQAAFDFIQYAVSKPIVQKRAEDLAVPVVLASAQDWYISLDPFNAVRVDCVSNGIGMPTTTWASIFQRVRNEAVQSVQNGGDPAKALNDAQQKLQQQIEADK